ncbi:MAG: thioredoxin family protein [Candidatus Marinimicrobia bacterium]|nr:thioredoxin family protein [Candidatus Neomarinimicrobiota bacterium]
MRLARILAMALVVGSLPLQAQVLSDIVNLEITVDRNTVRAGEQVTVHANLTIADGWHVYSSDLEGLGPVPTHFELNDSMLVTGYGAFVEPAAKRVWDEGFQINVGWHSGQVSLSQAFELSPDLPPGRLPFSGRLAFMACTETMCLPPADQEFNFLLDLEEGAPREQFALIAAAEPIKRANISGLEGTELQAAIQEGLMSFLLLAIGMGVLALLTPCVFPMIPITVSFFLKQGENRTMPATKSAGLYALGIIVIYSALGLMLALTLGAAGANQLAANPWVNLVLAGLFVYFALSLFGLYEIQLPARLRQFSLQQESRAGIMGIFFMSLTFTITSFTCTVQFVGLLLVAASQGHYLWPLIGMVTYSTAFAAPFFLLALFPQKLAQLPKSGGWLNSVKVVMGFLEIAAAFKFISNSDLVWSWGFFTHQSVLASWTVILALTGLYLLGKIRLPHDSPVESISVPRLLLSGTFLIITLLLGVGLTGQKIPGIVEAYLPPRLTHGESGVVLKGRLEQLRWHTELEDALAEARQVKRPVFLDITGYTCTNCRWMEANIFTEPEVVDHFERFVLLRLYTDAGDNYREKQRYAVEQFGTAALPFYAVLAPDGSELARLPQMTRRLEKFIRFLEDGLASYEQGAYASR